MTMRRSLTVRLALASMAMLGTLGLTVSVATTTEFTEAAWTDKEYGQATVKARWMEGFTRVTEPGWQMRNVRDAVLPANAGVTGPVTQTRNFAMSYPTANQQIATGNDELKTSIKVSGYTLAPEIVPPRDPSKDLWMGRYITTAANLEIASARHCMSYPSPATMTGVTTSSCGGSQARLVADQFTDGYTFAIIAGDPTKAARVNVSQIGSTVQCFSDGKTSASFNYGSESILQLARQQRLAGDYNGHITATQDIRGIVPDTDDPLVPFDGTSKKWVRFNVNGATDRSFVLAANIRKNIYRTDYYALAEMDLIIQVYSAGGTKDDPGKFIDQINLPITRSECGFSNGLQPLPVMSGTWRGHTNQLGWPGRSLGTTAPANSSRYQEFDFADTGDAPDEFSRMALQAPPDSTPTTSLPSATTVTSPLESATATVTTTSAPPDPSTPETSESSTPETTETSTSSTRPTSTTKASATKASTAITTTAAPSPTAPAIVIPSKPTDLGPTEQTVKAGTVPVDGTEEDVIVPGETRPTEAKDAALVLDTWLNNGQPPGADWKVFTSPDTEADGWRWAAISQTTGTVFYIR